MYAIVKTGGKQYRVQEGQYLLVERLAAEDGESVSLTPLLYVNGEDVVDGDDISRVQRRSNDPRPRAWPQAPHRQVQAQAWLQAPQRPPSGT